MTVYTYNPGKNDEQLGVKCDACGKVLWTNRGGQEFGMHVHDAKQAGYATHKENGKWVNYCGECEEMYRKRKRIAYFGVFPE